MKLPALAVIAAAFALPAAASAQDVLTAKKLACTPDKVTRCKSAGVECESKEATARDKTQPLILDFAGKKGLMRREKEERPVGDITDDKVEGEVRVVVLGGPGGQVPLTFRIKKDGKTEGVRRDGTLTMEISCKPE
jgi:hypothetical protein